VPENLAGHFQERGPSIVAPNNQRGIYDRETMNRAVGNIPAPRGYVAPHRQLVMHPAAFNGGYAHGAQVRGVSPRSGGSVAGGATRGSSGSGGVLHR
jgi:hypothetical protein